MTEFLPSATRTRIKNSSTWMGFEPTRVEHIGLAVQCLNLSATSSCDNDSLKFIDNKKWIKVSGRLWTVRHANTAACIPPSSGRIYLILKCLKNGSRGLRENERWREDMQSELHRAQVFIVNVYGTGRTFHITNIIFRRWKGVSFDVVTRQGIRTKLILISNLKTCTIKANGFAHKNSW